MSKIVKETVAISTRQETTIIKALKILGLNVERRRIAIYYLVDSSSPKTDFQITIIQENEVMRSDPGEYIGLANLYNNSYVYHVFAKPVNIAESPEDRAPKEDAPKATVKGVAK